MDTVSGIYSTEEGKEGRERLAFGKVVVFFCVCVRGYDVVDGGGGD